MTEPQNEPLERATAKAIDAIMKQVSAAFDEIWQRPDASVIVAKYLASRVVFAIDASGIAITEPTDGPPVDRPDTPPPGPGMYL